MKTIQEMEELKREVGCTDRQMGFSQSYALHIMTALTRIDTCSLLLRDDSISEKLFRDVVEAQKEEIERSLYEIARYLKLDIKKGESD